MQKVVGSIDREESCKTCKHLRKLESSVGKGFYKKGVMTNFCMLSMVILFVPTSLHSCEDYEEEV